MTKEERQRRKELARGLKDEERRRAEAELPASKEVLEALFSFLDEKLDSSPCDNTLRLTMDFARANQLDDKRLTDWTKEYGGYCDCEVLANVPDSNPVFRN